MFRANKQSLYTLIIAIFITVLITSNIASAKLFSLLGSGIIIDGGTILFPFAYIIGDIVTEVYGFKKAKHLIYIGFIMSILTSITLYVVQILPPAVGWNNQDAYIAILGALPRIITGSLCAYLIGEILNSYVMARLKVITNGKYLWVRTIGSTLVGALVDTTIFSFIAFYGTIPDQSLVMLIATVYTIKVSVEVIVTPITYKIIRHLKNVEGVDHFDRNLNIMNALKG